MELESFSTEADVLLYMAGEDLSLPDDAARQGRVTKFPHVLKNPLTRTELLKLQMALENLPEHPEIRSRANLTSERRFSDAIVRSGFATGCTRSIATDADVIALIRDARRYGRARPQDIPIRESRRVYSAVRGALASRQSDPGPSFTSLSSRTLEAAGGALLHRDAYDKVRRGELPTATPWHIYGSGRMSHIITPWGAGHKVGTRFVYYTLTFVLAVIEPMENLLNAHLGYDVLQQSRRFRVLTHEYMDRVVEWQYSCVERYGGQGHAIAKATEAIFKTVASRLSGGDIPGTQSGFDKMAAKYEAKEAALGATEETLLTPKLVTLALLLETPEEAVEMSGLMRMFGYPIVDPLVSAAKSRRLGSAPDRSKPEAIVRAVQLFSHLVLKNYIAKHGRWPPITFRASDPSTPDAPPRNTRLKQLHDSGILNIIDRSYPLEDWDEAEIHDIGEFDYHTDYLELLADKATFCGLELRPAHYAGRLPDPLHRRLISRILGHTTIDMKEELWKFATDQLSPDVFGCDLVPKELEHKAEARMYTIIDETVRRCLSTVQENVKSGIFPYVPYTSMAMNAAQLSKELHASTRNTGRRLWKLEIDLSSWNIRFLRLLCELMGSKMDKMMGVIGLFGQSHRFFQRSEFCVTTRDARIPQLEDPTLRGDRAHDNDAMWGNDASGKEGIEQRFWTVLTEVMMYLALWDEPYSFKLLGQGDNQTMVVDFGIMDDAELARESERISAKIEATCLSLNHDAKPEEFLGSMSMLTYSKTTMIDGRQIPLELKFAMKMGHSVDELDPSVEDAVGTIFSAGLAVAKNARNPLDAWVLSCVHAEWFLWRAARGQTEFPRALTTLLGSLVRGPGLALALTVPSVIGGFPIVPWTNYLTTGDPDPLSAALAMVSSMSGFLPVMRGVAGFLMADASYVEQVDLRSLIENPTGIPLASAPGGISLLRDAATEYLTSVRNNAISELATEAMQATDQLTSDLVSMRPLFPMMVRDLMDISSVGRAQKVVGKFKASATVSSIVSSAGIGDQMVVRGWQRFASTIARITSMVEYSRRAPRPFPHPYAYDNAEHLRLRWGLGEGGIQGVSTMQALDYPVSTLIGPGVVGVVSASYDLDQTGPHRPYMGSRTRERRAEREYEVVREPGTADLGKLILSLTAGQVSPSVRDMYQRIVASRTGLSLEQLAAVFPSTIGGTPGHRYDAMRDNSSMAPVGNPAPLGWLSLNTDHIPGVSASAEDWPLPLQMFMSWTCAYASINMRQGVRDRRVIRIGVSVDGMVPLPDPRRDMPPPTTTLRRLVGNPLVDVPDVTVRAISERIHGSCERLNTRSRESQAAVLSGIVAARLIRSGGGDMVAELGIEPTGASIEPDAAACVAMGGMVIFAACARACALAGVWHAMGIIATEENRHHIDAVLDNLSYSAAGIAHGCLRHPGVDKSDLVAMSTWVVGVGEGGDRVTFDVLRRNIRWHAGNIVRTPGHIRTAYRDTWIPDRSRGLPIAFGARYQLCILCWGWMVGSGARITGMAKRFIRDSMRQVRESRLHSRAASALAIPLAEQVSSAFSRLIHDADLSVHLDLLSLSGVIMAGVPTSDYDETTAWRSLRVFDQAPLPQAHAARLVLDDGDLSAAEYHLDMDDIINIPGLDPDVETRSMEEVIEDRFARTAGRRTTVAQSWAGIITQVDSPALVVGTGAGGVQALLASLHGSSEGLDLATTLPHSAAADPTYVPPECQGVTGARYSPAVWETSGNWFDAAASTVALSQRQWRSVIIDIEAGATRFGLEVLAPLCEARYTGRVHVRLILTRSEVESSASALAASPGVSGLRVVACQRSPPTEIARPVVLSFRCRGLSRIPDRGPRVIVSRWGDRRLPSDAADPRTRFRRSVQALTGGLIHADTPEELSARLDARADEARRSRATTTHGTLLSSCKIHYAMSIISALADVPEDRRHTPAALAREYVAICVRPRAPGNYGLVTVRPDDPHVNYLLYKILPRVVASSPV
uniref:RNA-directed RNA polymerase n=1 Tax=Rhizoctonia cerealis phyllomonavirus TaxID=3068671 RepID=A0AA51BSD8_9MONO|nr:MAG: RNA-dependent RNA polymerase [Rhizoctonia cerealis phyllomonavirus]